MIVLKDLNSNPGRAWVVLRWLNAGALIHTEAMNSDGAARPIATTYTEEGSDSFKKYLQANNDADHRRNIYFLPNAEFLTGKRNKANISAARFLHADLDAKDYPGTEKEQMDRILKLLFDPKTRPHGIPEPSFTWFTGGGYQALWRLNKPLEPDVAENLNKRLVTALEGDPSTSDVSRLLRLPCTVNWLNDRKRKSGRKPALSEPTEPVQFKTPITSYDVRVFDLPELEHGTKPAPTASDKIISEPIQPLPLPGDILEILPKDEHWLAAIKTGQKPPGKKYKSRSDLMFATTIWMLSGGVEPGQALSVLLSPDFAIGDHIRDRTQNLADAEKYAERQVRRAQMVVEARRSDWPSTTDKGFPTRDDPNNIRHALAKSGVVIRRNEFTQEDEFEGGQLDDRDFNDIADILCSLFQRKLYFMASPAAIKRELTAVAHENRYQPVLDYLDQVQWDGKPRIDTWLVEHCEVEDTDLHREFASKTLIAAVRRIKKPGVKFDTMLVLEGAQGVGKSRLLRLLAVHDAWFCESLNLRDGDRERAQILGRAWIVECQELDGLNKIASENLKKFLSESTDTYRKPYDKNPRHYPRHCIIVGTTNESDYLRDLTGNRRFWPVRVGNIDLDGLAAVVDQLWAEAVVREADGDTISLSPELWSAATVSQEQRVAEDPFVDVVAGALGDGPGKISMDSIKLLLGIPTAKLTAHDSRRIRSAMKQQGWDYGTFRLWVQSRGERRPVRGFSHENSDPDTPEIGIQVAKDGQIIVGEITAGGLFSSISGELLRKGEPPF